MEIDMSWLSNWLLKWSKVKQTRRATSNGKKLSVEQLEDRCTPATFIDLDPYAVDAPASALRGSTVSVFTDVDNHGSSPSGSYTVAYYLSTDSTITTSDIWLKSVSRTSIAAWTYQQWNESVVIPASMTPGNYYLGVVVDPFGAIAETN